MLLIFHPRHYHPIRHTKTATRAVEKIIYRDKIHHISNRNEQNQWNIWFAIRRMSVPSTLYARLAPYAPSTASIQRAASLVIWELAIWEREPHNSTLATENIVTLMVLKPINASIITPNFSRTRMKLMTATALDFCDRTCPIWNAWFTCNKNIEHNPGGRNSHAPEKAKSSKAIN